MVGAFQILTLIFRQGPTKEMETGILVKEGKITGLPMLSLFVELTACSRRDDGRCRELKRGKCPERGSEEHPQARKMCT